jgi:hypothetical protein
MIKTLPIYRVACQYLPLTTRRDNAVRLALANKMNLAREV